MPKTAAHLTPIAQVAEYLDTHNVLNLATVGADGPWAAAVFYARDGACLHFLSAAHTRHATNIQSQTAQVAGTIARETNDWQAIKGIQLQGNCTLVADSDRARIIELYARKFTVTGPDAPEPIARALNKIGWYTIVVQSMFFIDNSHGLGHREVVELGELSQLPG